MKSPPTPFQSLGASGTRGHRQVYHKGQHSSRGRCCLVTLAWEKYRIRWSRWGWILPEHAEVWAKRFKPRESRNVSCLFSVGPMTWTCWPVLCGIGRPWKPHSQHNGVPTQPATAVGSSLWLLAQEAAVVTGSARSQADPRWEPDTREPSAQQP